MTPRKSSIIRLLSVLAIGVGWGGAFEAAPKAMAGQPASQSMYIQYRGALISDTHVPGEGKADRIAPEIASCVQVSRDKWVIAYGTVDPRGHDINRSLFYQIRQGAPDGAVLKEGIIELAISGWDPLGVGHDFRKINAVVKVFGVPKGALRNGEPLPTANHFVVKWYIRPCLEINGRLVNLWEWNSTVDPADLGRYAYTLEWLQFRLNDAEDDIEIISPARELRQQGYDQGDVISSLGESKGIHHGFGDAVPNEDFTEWVEVLQFEKKLAAVRYAFDPATGLYEWVETGNAQEVPGRHLAEASLNRIDNDWVISARAYDAPWTAWYRTSDPFATFGDRTDVASPYVPRIAFVCADGVLRLFSNDTGWRNPIYSFDVDPITFEYSNKRVVLDATTVLPFRTPTIDHAMIFPHSCGNRQIISFRAINRSQTTGGFTEDDELMASGIHYSELIYDKAYPNPWGFDFCGTEQVPETAFTFDGIAPVNGWVNLTNVTPLVRNGYTLTLEAGHGGILDRTWNASSGVAAFTGGVCGGFSDGLVVSFARNNGRPFAATSVAVGSLLNSFPLANWTVTGHFASGGSEQTILHGFAGTKTITNFPSHFRNLTNLVFTGVGNAADPDDPDDPAESERPAFDELVLVDAPDNPSRVVMDFNGAAGAPGPVFATFAAGDTYRQYGYTLTNRGGTTLWFFDNDRNPHLNAFEDDVVQFPSGATAGQVRVERDDGLPFVAISVVIGGLASGTLTFTGNRADGRTVTFSANNVQGANVTVTLPDNFRYLQSLDIAASQSSGAAIDDLTLTWNAPVSPSFIIR